MTTKHTPGPLSVSFGTKWPFEILIINESGGVVYQKPLPCHSNKDKNFEEALNCLNFKASEQEEYAAINHRAVADAYLRAAAPDLLRYLKEARRTLEMWKDVAPAVSLCADIDAAIARATGESE